MATQLGLIIEAIKDLRKDVAELKAEVNILSKVIKAIAKINIQTSDFWQDLRDWYNR